MGRWEKSEPKELLECIRKHIWELEKRTGRGNWAGLIAEFGAIGRGRAGERKCPHSLAPKENT